MDFLDDDEKLIWEGKVSTKYVKTTAIICLFMALISSIVPILITYFVSKKEPNNSASIWFYFIICLMMAIFYYIMYFALAGFYKHKKYIITNKRIYIITNFINTKTTSLDIEDIKGFEISRSFSDRMKSIDCAGIDFHSPSIHSRSFTAGGIYQSKFAFQHLTQKDANDVLKIIKELKKKNENKKDN